MSRNAVILGGGQGKWGVREAHIMDLFQEAGKACLDDIPGLKPLDIDGLIVATSYAGRCSFQVNTAPVVAERLGLKPTSICTRCDTLCAGGSTGIILAKGLVESGNADIVMVTGGEKLYTPQKWEIFYSELASVDHDWEATHGMGLPPPFFSLTAQEHMIHYGTKKEDLAAVSVANYNYAADNPVAQMQKNLTLEEAMSAPSVVPPLTLYDCCPITDGAAACIITTDEIAKKIHEQAPRLSEGLRAGIALQPFRQLPRRAPGRLEAHEGSGGEGIQEGKGLPRATSRLPRRTTASPSRKSSRWRSSVSARKARAERSAAPSRSRSAERSPSIRTAASWPSAIRSAQRASGRASRS